MKRLLSLLLVLCVVLSCSALALASNVPDIGPLVSVTQSQAAGALYKLNLFKGKGTDRWGNPIYDLNSAPTRAEAITMLVRLLGKEDEAIYGTWITPFTDVPAWAEPYVGYAYANAITLGTSETTFGSNDKVTATQYLTFVLTALGYERNMDFAWDQAWILSDRLHVTSGEYPGNGKFLRGNVAVISLSALYAKRKDDHHTLAQTLMESGVFSYEDFSYSLSDVETARYKDAEANRKKYLAGYLKRVLTDEELNALAFEPIDVLRARISTLGDAIAFIAQFNAAYPGQVDRQEKYSLDPAESLLKIRATKYAGFEDQTNFAFYVLADDYPEMGMLVGCAMTLDNYSYIPINWVVNALVIPRNDGMLIVSAPQAYQEMYPSDKRLNLCADVQLVRSLSEVSIRPACVFTGTPMSTWYYVSQANADAVFSMKTASMNIIHGSAELIYSDGATDVELPDSNQDADSETLRQEKILFAEQQVNRNYASFGVPVTDTKPSWEEAESWYGLSLGELDKKINSMEDMIYYLAASGYNAQDPGVDIGMSFDRSNSSDILIYYYNKAPEKTLKDNYGCCGVTSGLWSYLLRGDYDEVGIVNMTFTWGKDGGHVISYVRNGNEYYVFDPVNLTSGYHKSGFNFQKAPTLKEACQKWIDNSGWSSDVECMICVPVTEDGDGIIGWRYGSESDHKSYIPKYYLGTDYYSSAEIIVENPADGYVYEWVELTDVQQELIHASRYQC